MLVQAQRSAEPGGALKKEARGKALMRKSTGSRILEHQLRRRYEGKSASRSRAVVKCPAEIQQSFIKI